MKVLEEQFRSACTVEIASFDRFTDFLGKAEFDAVIFGTAPTGHTVRLLELPVDWSAHIEESAKGSGQTCIGPVSSIQDCKAKDDRCTFLLIFSPEYTPVFEAKGASEDLRDAGIEVQGVIANCVLDQSDCATSFTMSRFRMQQHYLRVAAEEFGLPMFKVPMLDGVLAGKDALERVGRELFGEFRIRDRKMFPT